MDPQAGPPPGMPPFSGPARPPMTLPNGQPPWVQQQQFSAPPVNGHHNQQQQQMRPPQSGPYPPPPGVNGPPPFMNGPQKPPPQFQNARPSPVPVDSPNRNSPLMMGTNKDVPGPFSGPPQSQAGFQPRPPITMQQPFPNSQSPFPGQGPPPPGVGSQGPPYLQGGPPRPPLNLGGPMQAPPMGMPPFSGPASPPQAPPGANIQYTSPSGPPSFSNPNQPPTSMPYTSTPSAPPAAPLNQPVAISSANYGSALPTPASYSTPAMHQQTPAPQQQPVAQQAPPMANRYPPQNSAQSPVYPSQQTARSPVFPQPTTKSMDGLTTQMGSMSVTQQGFNRLWGNMETYDLMQMRNILPPTKVEAPRVNLQHSFVDAQNCSPDIFRCTVTKIPETKSILDKSRLPLGILIHPFKDLSQLPVIQCNTIVRCRACRTYINPFVYFIDHRRWKCNICFRVNELPDEFQYDPVSKTYGEPTRRPEVRSATIEFIAPSEYMVRPPQPAVYLFVLEVSRAAVDTGYLKLVCDILLEELDNLPGDSRTQIGFITYDSAIHFYELAEDAQQPHMMVVGDIDDIFLPCPENLLVNLHEDFELVRDLLAELPNKFQGNPEPSSALGAALQASFKLMGSTGGRVTVFQVTLPSLGPGALQPRTSGGSKDASPLLNPAIDFYKRLALECSAQQVAVDLFLLNSQTADLATISGIARFSGGCINHFPDFHAASKLHSEQLTRCFRRYLTRKIGLEAVMRVRCTRGLAIHTFHGNFFVRSTDLLSLPNVSPDSGFGMQLAIEENLSDMQNVCLQAALLYTSSKGERRIRVHTLCLPIASNISEVIASADQQCIVGLLTKMAVDRSQSSSLSDAREAFINVAVDVLSTFRATQNMGGAGSGLLAPHSLRLLPLYIVALLRHPAFRASSNVRIDDRVYAMCQFKSLPLDSLMQSVFPDLYPLHCLTDEGALEIEGKVIPQPPRLHLSAEKLDSRGLFLIDTGDSLIIYVLRNINPALCRVLLGANSFEAIPDVMTELPVLDNQDSERMRAFVNYLKEIKPYPPPLQIIREDSKYRSRFMQYLLEDRSESSLSYYEFLQHLKTQVK
ncbi:protein transport protein Sec24A [Neocloeon triangulifer]|uniref:protein transport protein Sec24A n=1 Tax=Neocloeon triangulifer TaxID=2078957 RepID=UPI00286FAA67|nr:protein transport protein Sec24A [Neocloeon triangulifer]